MRGVRSDDKFYQKLQEKHGPVFKLFWGSRQLKICLVGYDRGRRLLAQFRDILDPINTDISSVVPHGYLRSMKGETHSCYRRAFIKVMRDDLLDGLTGKFRTTIQAALNQFAEIERSNARSQRLSETLDEMSSKLLFTFVYGVDSASKLSDLIYEQYSELGSKGYIEDVGHRQKKAYTGIRHYVAGIELEIRRGNTREYSDCVLRRLVSQHPDDDLNETLIGNSIYMIERGRHDLRDLLRWTVKYLSDNPVVVDELRNVTGGSNEALSLAEACIMETLRLDQAESINRDTTESFQFEGYDFPKGAGVAVLMRETHQDDRVFEQPEQYRPERFLRKSFSANEYSPFGLDAHQCIAANFVTTIGAMFVDELVHGYRWDVVGDGPRVWGHFHWQPSQFFDIRLAK